WAAALGGHMHGTGRFVQQVAGEKWQPIQWRQGWTQGRTTRFAALPDVVDGGGPGAGLESGDQVQHRLRAFTEAEVVEARRRQDEFWGKGGVQPAGDDRDVDAGADGLDEVASAQPLAGRE